MTNNYDYYNNNSFYPIYSGIINLYKKDFNINYKKKKFNVIQEEFINKNGLIIFYKKKCKKCIDNIPKWCKIASMFKYKFPIGAVDCDNDFGNDLRILLDIIYFPNVKYTTKYGNIINFNESLDEDDLIFYIYNKIST